MQVTNINPTLPKKDVKNKSEISLNNIFAIGDVCLTRINEAKSVIPINMMVDALASNIRILSSPDLESQEEL